MKHTIYETTFVPTEIEIPDKCPDCGADFHKSGALIEGYWQDCTTRSHIQRQNATDPALHLEPSGQMDYGDTYYSSGVVCANPQCDWNLTPRSSGERAS